MVRGQAYCLRPAWSFNLTPPICLQHVVLWHDPFFHHWVSDIWQVYVVTAHVGLHMIRCILILIIYVQVARHCIIYHTYERG